MSVICTHKGGFFSTCSVRLKKIVDYINLKKEMPSCVDSSKLFNWYKVKKGGDVTFDYFQHYDNIKDITTCNKINYHPSHQFINYVNVDYNNVIPIVKKYFSPSNNINNIINNIEYKYGLIYDNICVLLYRGNDKIKETKLCGYAEYLKYANLLMKNNPNILFLIQSDETGFIKFMTKKFPDNSFYFKDEIRHIKKSKSTVDKIKGNKNCEYSKNYLAITIIMSKCKYVLCGSGNCSIWVMFYRENNDNVCQYLKGKWHNTIKSI
jgi:hypothetical protein